MGTPWRFSARVCLSHLRCCFRLKPEELRPLGPLGYHRGARVCWLLLGSLPKLISASGDVGVGVPGRVCLPKAPHRSDVAEGRAGERGRRVLLPLRLCVRAGLLLAKFFPLLLLYPLTYLAPGLAALWFHLLLKATETSGPTYIKLGQWASTRRDLFSEDFCALFSRLHVQVAPHPWAHTERSLLEAFGKDWGHVLFFETQTPVGSGCVAQVYKAFASPALLGRVGSSGPREAASGAGLVARCREVFGQLGNEWKIPENLADQSFLEKLLLPEADPVGSNVEGSRAPGCPPEPGRLIPVAVKVLHPGLLSQVHMDLLLMKIGSRVLGLLPGVKWLSLPEVVDEFEKLMVQQVDLRYEAQNLEHFQRNFENVTSVRFPTPLRPFVAREVLVETYEESVPVSSYQQAGIPDALKRKIARLGINMLLKMIFVDNFVHGDLHPGNILVQGADGLSPSREEQLRQADVCDTLTVAMVPALRPLRLVLLDAGIVSELQASDLSNFRAVFLAVVMGQGHKVAELFLHHSRANECKDVERFKAEMATLVTQARKNIIALEQLQVSNLLSNVFKLLMIHKVKLESNFASIVLAIMVLEGLGRSLDPQLDILEAAKPFLLKGSMSIF
ncbi:uncharacterized aarF domain-containing protein kinase 2 [Perognathus longimembris pacificus]|uniref:uncharacterized aarF domain-containing protein kinase 2 n=1 Tax=Perognathus longimembris pacificus TaxID=214514 RepID=UPI0020185A8D|nr:uncharacterized aarF domain-containing protein kinase 2 [Perognathus longimembris pacificus]